MFYKCKYIEFTFVYFCLHVHTIRYGEEIGACCIVALEIDKRLYKRQTDI
jgi:hypothetical protein